MKNIKIIGKILAITLVCQFYPTTSFAYVDIGCTVDENSTDFIFNCYIDINDPVWYTDVDGLRVNHRVRGWWQQCWDDTTNTSADTGQLTQDDMTYPTWVNNNIVHYIEIKVEADKVYGPDPSILLHWDPEIKSTGAFYYHSISSSSWGEYVPSPDTRVHAFDYLPTPCD